LAGERQGLGDAHVAAAGLLWRDRRIGKKGRAAALVSMVEIPYPLGLTGAPRAETRGPRSFS
jgi:hypothetical protein